MTWQRQAKIAYAHLVADKPFGPRIYTLAYMVAQGMLKPAAFNRARCWHEDRTRRALEADPAATGKSLPKMAVKPDMRGRRKKK